jgi:prolyl 4-hydroxylase
LSAADRPIEPEDLLRLRWGLRLGTDMSTFVEYLRERGYSDRSILVGLEQIRPRGNSLEGGAINHPPLLKRNPPNLHRVETDKVQMYTLDEFLTPQECESIIALAGLHLKPSGLTFDAYDNSFRTSQTAELCGLRNPVATSLDEKICRTLGIRTDYSEGIQAQRYDVGQQFKSHWDFFEPGTQVFQRWAGVRGNRTWTFMVYLNEGMEGGATRFQDLNLAFTPKLGMALFWNNLRADGTPNPNTMHCGEPVLSGFKMIITKWFRVFGHGPVFYE